MKIGILTVHSQINYGAVLQAFALQSVLENAGHEVVVLDRQLDADSVPLLGALKRGSFVCWAKLIARGMLFLGDFSDLLRRIRTARFIRKHLNLSRSPFISWTDLHESLDIDLIVVGSDQIWNTKSHDPHVYLLDFPHSIPAISYAASFGTDSIDERWIPLFRQRLPVFKRISVREKQAARILDSLGISSTKVFDPTLIAERTLWKRFIRSERRTRRVLSCYLALPPSWCEMRDLATFCKRNNCRAEVFTATVPVSITKGWRTFRDAAARLILSLLGHVQYRPAATPDEVVNSIANANWVVTSAFHGLMFSCIFQKQVRLIRKYHKDNLSRFRRMEEFVEDFMKGNVVVDELGEALKLLESEHVDYNNEEIEMVRSKSIMWLLSAIRNT